MTHNQVNKEDHLLSVRSLKSSISLLKQQLAIFKKERKAEWKLFKHSFQEEMNKIKKNSKALTDTKKP